MGQKRSKLHTTTSYNTTPSSHSISLHKRHKVLFLGASECGKSTFFNQSLSESNVSPMDTRDLLFDSILSNLSEMIRRGALCEEVKLKVRKLLEGRDEGRLCDELMGGSVHAWSLVGCCTVNRVDCLWEIWNLYFRDKFLQYVFYNGIENTQCMIEGLRCGGAIGRDVFSKVCHRTTGVICRDINEYLFLEDVGGRRNERKKWIYCFEDVGTVFFFASLTEFDQVLKEDESTNRMKESLLLFEEISKSRWFTSTRIVLILTKPDILVEKMTRFKTIVDLTQLGEVKTLCRSVFDGMDRDVGLVLETIVCRYEERSANPLEYHIVNATSEHEVKLVVEHVLKKESKEAFISPSLFTTKPLVLHKNLHHTMMKGNLCDLTIFTTEDIQA